MNLHLLFGYRPLFVVFDVWILVMLGLVYPMVRDYGDDCGDGKTLVLLPPPKLPHLGRTFAYMLAFIVLVVLYHSVAGPYSPDALYESALRRVVDHVLLAPSQVEGFLTSFTLGLRVLVFAAMLSLTLTCRATPMRRVSMLVQCLWYIAAVFLFDCLLIVITVITGLGVGPGTIFGNWFAIGVGFLAMSRLFYANFALPKPTALVVGKGVRSEDVIVLFGTTAIGMCISLTVLAVVYEAANPQLKSFLAIFAPVPFSYLTIIVRDAFLGVLGLVFLRTPPVGTDRPEINVIIPAYNEEEVIVDTLRSIDAAAARYGGPITVILTDDGSTDCTRPLAEEAMAAFVAATGRIIEGGHNGKSAALNLALAETTSDIVVRIDADTVIDDAALVYLPRWFNDPEIGMVEGMMWPRWEPNVYCRLRLFEELRIFGLNHRILQSVDAISVVPGVFAAFRRAPAVELGGFTVGMNGEDGDFTMRMARVGWQTRLDPKILVSESVPVTFLEIREQRVRWDRATLHNQARHGIYRAGVAATGVWFTQTNMYFRRVRSPIFFMLPMYIAIYAAFEGTWRSTVVAAVAATIVGQVAFMIFSLLLATGYGYARYIGWALLWPVWRCCLTMFSTESLLSLPGRPFHLFTRRRQVISEAVVH
jgi:cellulose synthase/poly-beta-1,6-N-acetylglucosamine synthase-like glycosyltransferase